VNLRSATALLLVAAISTLAGLHLHAARGEEPVAPPPVAAESPEVAPAQPVSPADAVVRLMRALRADDGPIRSGISAAKASRATPGAARFFKDRTLPLAGSWLDPDSVLQGTVDWSLDLETESEVRLIRVVLLVGPIEPDGLRKTIYRAGKSMGLEFDLEDDDPNPWHGEASEGIELWIAMGDGIVVIEANQSEE
jgi:hypothetical protein